MKKIFCFFLFLFCAFCDAGEQTFPQQSQDWSTAHHGSFIGWYLIYTGNGKFTTVAHSSGYQSTFFSPAETVIKSTFADFLTGELAVTTGSYGSSGVYGVYTVKTCPDTSYCQKSACGAYCSVHDSGGGTCSNITCPTCGTTFCITHLTHMCFSGTCPEGNTHSFSGTAKKDSTSDVAALQAAYNAAYPQTLTCSQCNAAKCSICAHTCRHTSECVLKNCTVCGVQWCNIHGIVPIYTTCGTCGRMTCNHQTHTCNPNDPNNPNQNPNQTNAETANNTTQIANNTQTTANNTTQIANNTQTTANNTTQIANNTQQTANNTQQTANNTANIANNTAQMAGALNNIQSGVTNAAGAAQNAADAANAIADKIPDPVEPPEMLDKMEELPDRSDAFVTLSDKLLPSFSFFSVSGSNFPSWTFSIPVSMFSRGLSDITFTLGGDAWGTVAEGKLLWVMSITRGLSCLVFAFMFLFGIIRALRQW